MELIAITLNALGEIFIGWAALRVHHRVLYEHRIDQRVFKAMKREQKLGITGILFIAISYFMKVL